MTSKKKPKMEDLVKNPRNRMFFPLHEEGYNVWAGKSVDDIRHELARRPEENLQARKRAAAVAYGTEKKDQEEHAAQVDSRV
jgi:hypothetical protein